MDTSCVLKCLPLRQHHRSIFQYVGGHAMWIIEPEKAKIRLKKQTSNNYLEYELHLFADWALQPISKGAFHPFLTGFDSRSAIFCLSTADASTLPHRSEQSSGVLPYRFLHVRFAPASTRHRTVLAYPLLAAICNGLFISRLTALTLAPSLIKSIVASVLPLQAV